MGPLGGAIMGMAGAGAGAGLGATLGAGLKGAIGATPIGGALSAAGVPGLSGGVSRPNPIASAVQAMTSPQPSTTQTFQPSAASAAADTGAKTAPTVNATPTQSFPGAVNPSALWASMKAQGFNDAQSAALLGNMKQESEFRPGAVNPGEGAQGLIQWRGSRLANLQSFAAQQGKPYTDPNVQVAFLKHEMQTTEAGPGQKFLAATTPQEANAALKGYIRYGSPPDKGGLVTRQQNTDAYYRQFAGQAPTAGVLPQSVMSTPNAQVSATPAQSGSPLAQSAENFVKTLEQKKQMAAAPAPAATPAIQTGNLAAERTQALLSPAAQLLDQLKQRQQNAAAPTVGGRSPVSI